MFCAWRKLRWSSAGMSQSRRTARSAASLSRTLRCRKETLKQITLTGISPLTWCGAWRPASCTTFPHSPSNAAITRRTPVSLPPRWYEPVGTHIKPTQVTVSLVDGQFINAYFCAGPRRVEELQVVNVTSSQVWLSWLVPMATVDRVHVSLLPSDGSEAQTAVLNTSTTEYSFRSASAPNSSQTCSFTLVH